MADSKLLTLRASLNTPVLATEELSPGPAEAAILVLAGPDGAPSVTLVVRSVRSGAFAFYGFEGPLDGEADLETALDGALSFGESMGFLFDDDALAQSDAASQRLLASWLALLGELAGPPPPARGSDRTGRRLPARPPAGEESVLEIGIAVSGASVPELVLDRPIEPDPAPVPAATAAAPRAPLPLTKFRRTPAASAAETRSGEKPATAEGGPKETPRGRGEGARAPADGDSVLLTPHGPAVGRVQLVKQRREEAQATPLDPLLRLLASL